MILFLTLFYVAILALLVKFKVIPLNLWWKLSPVFWMVFLLVSLFIPMQFWAPAGPLVVMNYSIPIVPNVSGEVVEVPVEPNVAIQKGEVLFRIEQTPFIAARDQIKAQLALAQLRLSDSETLLAKNAISQSRVDQNRAKAEQLQASLMAAEYHLAQTVVRAPADGFVTNLALRPGYRAVAFPVAPAMIFVENTQPLLIAQVMQGYLRYVEPDMAAEVTFKLYPGKVYSAKVEYYIPASAVGQQNASGSMFVARDLVAGPFAVRIKLDEDPSLQGHSLPVGAVGSMAIYSSKGKATHIIRKVMIRMDAFMNYVMPF